MLQIPPAPKGMPVDWKGHCYGRNGSSIFEYPSDFCYSRFNKVFRFWLSKQQYSCVGNLSLRGNFGFI
jgi:hypothetical protein